MNNLSDRPASASGLDKAAVKWVLRTLIIFTAMATIGFWIFSKNLNFILLLAVSWLIAIAMEPAVTALANRGWRRGAATGLVMFGIFLVSIGFLTLFGGILFSQATSLITNLPVTVANLTEWVNQTFNQQLDPNTMINQLNVEPAQLAGAAGNFAGGIVGVVSGIVGALFQTLTLALFVFYFSADAPRLRRQIGSMMNPRAQHILDTTWDITVKKTGGYVISKVIMAVASGTAHAIFFSIIGVPYWLPLAIITGITSQFIPTIGTYLGILIPVLFVVFRDPNLAILIIIFAAIYQQIENYLLSPRLSKITMDIHPAIAFGSVIVFANLFGVVGAFVSVPIAAAMVALLDTYGKRYELISELEDSNLLANNQPNKN
jgi:predicted PurR-regulated permease PerM